MVVAHHVDVDEEIARRTTVHAGVALALEANTLTVDDPRRNADVDAAR
jgi:hypothetical protein